MDLDGMTGVIARSLRASMKASASKAFIGDQSAGIDGFDQRFGASQIVILARGEHHRDGIAESIDERVNLGGQSAARSADGLRAVFFWAPALCW